MWCSRITTPFYRLTREGAEKRDPRDTKGMKLWVAGAARAATVPQEKEPHWNAFEKVHISLTPVEVLAGQRVPQAATGSSRPQVPLPAAGQPALKADTAATNATESVNDLRLQMRELTNANLDLRSQLKEQSGTIEKLTSRIRGASQREKSGELEAFIRTYAFSQADHTLRLYTPVSRSMPATLRRAGPIVPARHKRWLRLGRVTAKVDELVTSRTS